MTADEPALLVDALSVGVRDLVLLEDVGFALARGERLGLIGESGSGKSLTALAVMGLLPEGLSARGSVRLPGTGELLQASDRELSRLRGRRLGMVFQEPMTALNPVMRIGDQVAEVMLVHGTQPDRASARSAVLALLEQVHLPGPGTVRAYPHQLSGGQRQRVVLAMALANDPEVLICDEPTTALDVTVQALVLDLVLRGVQERGSSLLFITHDLAVVATVCTRVLVMYGGRVVESGPVREVLTRPQHPYTRGLLDASDLEAVDERRRLRTIPGVVPPAGHFPDGCVFRTRCPNASPTCASRPPWSGDEARGYACFHPVGEPARA